MRIQHNIAALNSYRNLSTNNNAVSKNLEKLSSGYKINRAGDDAAGLAISEKMRAQITGLEVAQKNANDGISLVQTAEGALTEVHSMLNRMVELAEQSANGTYEDTVDRNNLQKEVTSLLQEVDRISEGTNFNGINLLDGSLGGGKIDSQVGVASVAAVTGTAGAAPGVTDPTANTVVAVEGDGAGTRASLTIDVAGAAITAPTDGSTGAKATITVGGQAIELDVTADMDDAAIANALNGKQITVGGTVLTATATGTSVAFEAADDTVTNSMTGNAGTLSITSTAGTIGGTARVDGSATTASVDFNGRVGADLIGGTLKVGNTTYEFVKNAADATTGTAVVLTAEATATEIATALAGVVTETGFTVAANGTKLTLTETGTAATDGSGKQDYAALAAPTMEFANVGLTLQIGDTADSFNKLTVRVDSMSTESLGISTINIGTQSGASDAIALIKTAINTVSSSRGDLGAIQNRLEHTINNLSVTTENMTAAESRIRDVDMAEEMMAYTKNNILIQASQAMLAQANQIPQGVLQLLQ